MAMSSQAKRALAYMAKKYGRPTSFDDAGNIIITASKDYIGYMSTDGWLVDATGDSDKFLFWLG